MDHLKEAKNLTGMAIRLWEQSGDEMAGQVHAQVAVTHALIALMERLDNLLDALETREQEEDALASYQDLMAAYPEEGDAAV